MHAHKQQSAVIRLSTIPGLLVQAGLIDCSMTMLLMLQSAALAALSAGTDTGSHQTAQHQPTTKAYMYISPALIHPTQ